MKASEDTIEELLEAYTSRTATPEQEEALFRWVASHPDDAALRSHVRRVIMAHREEVGPETDWDTLYRRILGEAGITRKRRHVMARLAAAASVVIVLAAGAAYFLSGTKKPAVTSPAAVTMAAASADVKPGTEKAVLRAAGASVVLHKTDTSFVLAGNTVQVSGAGLQIAEAKPVDYTLEVPRGGSYALTLADGTRVWLNAASTLKYPSVFTGGTREVWLEGEAYFQVHGSAEHPFVVHTSRQRISVLGTEFNIHAYRDDPHAVTTLVQGKVSVESAGRSLLLNPGEQALSESAGSPDIRTGADIAEVVAWKNGFFRFDKADIHSIMQELARWYDVDVVYSPGLDDHLFGAMISRDNNLSEVLDMLEKTGDIHFQITGRKVVVRP